MRDPKAPRREARERVPDPMSDPAQAQCLFQGLPIQFEDMVFLLQNASLTLGFCLKPCDTVGPSIPSHNTLGPLFTEAGGALWSEERSGFLLPGGLAEKPSSRCLSLGPAVRGERPHEAAGPVGLGELSFPALSLWLLA